MQDDIKKEPKDEFVKVKKDKLDAMIKRLERL
jgi:hypothetical protein